MLFVTLALVTDPESNNNIPINYNQFQNNSLHNISSQVNIFLYNLLNFNVLILNLNVLN